MLRGTVSLSWPPLTEDVASTRAGPEGFEAATNVTLRSGTSESIRNSPPPHNERQQSSHAPAALWQNSETGPLQGAPPSRHSISKFPPKFGVGGGGCRHSVRCR